MKERLFLNKIEVKKSKLSGYGLFAKKNIKVGEIIEECCYATIEPPINGTISMYHYSWPKEEDQSHADEAMDFSRRTIVFGFASMYNSSKTEAERNVDWYTDTVNDIYIFKAVKDIKKGEELCIYYGDAFWEEDFPKQQKEKGN